MNRNFNFMICVAVLMSSCLGDKKTINVEELGDTSFVNDNFNGNLINYTKSMSACDNISASDIASIYEVSEGDVIIQDVTKTDQRVPNTPPSCMFYIKTGDNDFEWLRGSISVHREIGKDEYMGDIAQAAGGGENWEDAWALKKSISKSSVWIKNMGQAALWNERKSELIIKFEGYTLNVYPIKNLMNKAEVAKNRDYKKAAIAMAKAAGFTN